MTKSLEEEIESFLAEKRDELEHSGVKGMKWGQRKAGDSRGNIGGAAPSRKELKGMDKATKAADNAKRNAAIDKARKNYQDKARTRYLDAKATYNVDKHVIGKAAAKKAFDKVKAQNVKEYEQASQSKSGKETVVAIAATSVLLVGYAAMIAASK